MLVNLTRVQVNRRGGGGCTGQEKRGVSSRSSRNLFDARVFTQKYPRNKMPVFGYGRWMSCCTWYHFLYLVYAKSSDIWGGS